jgi:CubicO group peptidase (beta-lactamase class C family)
MRSCTLRADQALLRPPRTRLRAGQAHAPRPAPIGQYGWDGGLGTIWRNDPSEQMVSMLLTNAAWTSPRPPDITLDFLTVAYAAIDD